MEQKMWMRGYLAELAAEGGAENPEDLAERLVILHEGANVAYSLGMAEDAAQEARQIAVTLVADLQWEGSGTARTSSAPFLTSRAAC
jgi:hypothetical protein